MSHRLPAFGLAALSVVALVTGCAPQAVPTPTPTPRFTSQAQAYQAAEATYRAYIDALNKVDLSDPATFEDVYKWETGDALNSDKKVLTGYHASGARLDGVSSIRLLQPSLTGDRLTSVQLSACLDVSDLRLTDASGKSLVDPNREDIHSTTVTLDGAPQSPTGYLVSGIAGREGDPSC